MDETVKLGGMPEMRLLAPAERDLDGVLQAVSDHTRSDATAIVVTTGATGRSDQFLQRLNGVADHPELDQIGLDDIFIADQFTRSLPDGADVVLLSMASDLEATPWIHRQKGWVVQPPPDWESTWSDELTARFKAAFESAGPLSPDAYMATMREVIASVRDRTGAHVILYGASTLGEDLNPSYHGRDDDHRLRLHKFNAAQIRLSMALGVSIIDVDLLIANVGGRTLVTGPLTYGDAARDVITEDIAFVLGDIGFFQKRPLVAQVGQEYGSA